MTKEKIKALIEGGKATAAPPLGPALGPLGVNIGLVIAKINEKTKSFAGMQVPVEVIVEKDTKEFEITVGTPPTSSLILKEAGVEKGAANPLLDKIADVLIEQIIKIAKMKENDLLGKDLKAKVKEVIGTCNSMGILVEGVPAREAIGRVNAGEFDTEIKAEKTQLSQEELKALEEEKKRLREELEKRKADMEARAKDIIAQMPGQERSKIKSKLLEAKIPTELIEQLLPVEAAGAAAPAAGAKAPAGEAKKEEKKAEKKAEKK
jgi:large subunit ribosomal protein L11